MRGFDGFTLLEIMIAIVLLGITFMGLQGSMAERALRTTGDQERRAVGNQLLNTRVEEVRVLAENQYNLVVSGTESPVEGFPEWTRQTVVRISQAPQPTFRTVTVRVWTPALRDTLSRTLVVSP